MDTFCSRFSTPRGNLSPQDALEFAKIHLENARKSNNPNLISTLCADADAALSRIKRSVRKALILSQSVNDQALCNGIVIVYVEHGKLFDRMGSRDKAQASFDKAKKWHVQDAHGEPALSGAPDHSYPGAKDKTSRRDTAHVSTKIFSQNLTRRVVEYPLLKSDERISSAPQLAYCLRLLSKDPSVEDPCEPLDKIQRAWIEVTAKDPVELKRLRSLATKLVGEFIRDDVKEHSTVAEVLHVAPVLGREHYRKLLDWFIDTIARSILQDSSLLEGLTQLLQSAAPGHILADDLVKILRVHSMRLQDTHQQSTQYLHQLALMVSYVLDAMADSNVQGLSREQLHAPLSAYLGGLKGSSDPYLVYQAAYAYQALQYVTDDETPLQSVLRRTRVIVDGVSRVLTSFKSLDVSGFLDGLGQLHEGAAEVFQVAQAGLEGVSSLIDSGEGLVNSLKDGLSFSRKRPWYLALRGADKLLRDGQLADFKKLVCEAPCRRDPAFGWGLCQRLGEIAANPLWNANTRVSAIKFLGELYKNDTDWSQKSDIKQWIRTIFIQLSELPDKEKAIKSRAHTALQKLKKWDSGKQKLHHDSVYESPCLYLLENRSQKLSSPSLIDRAQDIPDVENDLSELGKRRLNERGNDVHIPPDANASLQGSNNVRFPLMESVQEFLVSDQQVLLLLGESGAGKSTFIRELECDLWKRYRKGKSRIPLHIHLPTIHRPDQDLIAKHLRRNDFTEPQIREMKYNREFILICDGYDESRQSHNLYTSNQLNQPSQWKAKMVISCRTEYLPQDYKDRFQPDGHGSTAAPRRFQEAVIVPFSEDQIQDYIKQYVFQNKPLWRIKDYRDALKNIPNLLDLVKNPFLLSLSLEVLPRVVDVEQTQDLSRSRITRVELYDQFVEHWLERDKKRASGNELSPQAKAAYDTLVDGGFTQNGIHFLKELATAIYKEHGGHPVIEYSHIRDYGTWKRAFFSREDEIHLLREACPLIRNGNQYRFIHRSLLEYCFTLAVFDPQKSKTMGLSSISGRRKSVSSKLSFEEQAASVVGLVKEQQSVVDHPLTWRSFVNEPSIVGFLAERVQQEPHFKEQLLEMLEQSKTDKKGRTAAANAITILVRAGIPFNRADLRGIKIPGANLNGGQFDSAQLQGADLRKVNFCNIWLRRADLSNARMEGVQFGEWPYLEEDGEVTSSAYSPDGRACAVGLNNGTISVYDTATWTRTFISHCHSSNATSVVYSPSGQQIASGSGDNTVRLWDAQTGAPGPILSGHTERITSVVYSPNGQQIASSSQDKTVRLWDAETGTPGLTLSGHTDYVRSVVYSPSGEYIASCSDDNTIRLWDAQTGEPCSILIGHTNSVTNMVFSPRGQQIASCSFDMTVRLWHVESGTLDLTLKGHTDCVTSVVYSRYGHQIASGSFDKTVRLWNTQTGAPGPILSGHTERVTSVMYSPEGKQIASGSQDKTVRLWNTQTGAPGPVLRGHTDYVTSVVYSPSGHQIASGSFDRKVRLWDTRTDAIGPILSGHTERVTSVMYSPEGNQIASGSEDKTVRLWNAETGAPGPILSGHTDYVTSVVYSPSGQQISSGSQDRTVRLWDAETGAPGPILTGHTECVTSVVYSPSELQIASGSEDKTVRLWDAQTGAFGPILSGHTGGIMTVVYSPCGKQISSGSRDKTVRLWDVDSRKCLVVIRGCDESINSIAWNVTSEGTYLATGCDDKSVRVWQVMKEGDKYHVCLLWSSISDRLIVPHTTIKDARGLDWITIRLLRQRGAEGKPIMPLNLRGVGERVIRMAPQLEEQSRYSNLNTSSATNTPGGQSAKPIALLDASQQGMVYGKDKADLTREISGFREAVTAAIVRNGRDSLGVKPTTTSCMVTAANELEGGPQELKELARRQQEQNEEQNQSLQELKLQIAELKALLTARS